MIKNSFKQLLRRPAKVILFLLLICGCTVMIVLGTGMVMRTTQQIKTADEEYVTIGKVTQKFISEEIVFWEDPCREGIRDKSVTQYGPMITTEDLMFEGANYIYPPERRPMYVAFLPELNLIPREEFRGGIRYRGGHNAILEFRALDGRDDGGPVEVEITRVIFQPDVGMNETLFCQHDDGVAHYYAQVGDKITVCQHSEFYNTNYIKIDTGKTYVACLQWSKSCQKHDEINEYLVVDAACTSQHDVNGNPMESELFPTNIWWETFRGHWLQEVTESFYELGHAGVAWENQGKFKAEMTDHIFPVVATNSLNLMPSYYDGLITIDDGREITQEEFDTGAKVCMMSKGLAAGNGYKVGDKISLPLLASLHGYALPAEFTVSDIAFNLINSQGELYEPFWDEEYEIVGTFRNLADTLAYSDTTTDMFIIPSNSVMVSEENNIAYYSYMNGDVDTSFQIPNGSIPEFDAALRANVPQADQLEIEYDDKGYTQLVATLRKSQEMGLQILGGGLLATVAVIALLMYFFITREKKRSAVERSLGLTKRQCQVSLLAGIMLMTLLGTAIGGGIGYILLREPADVQPAENAVAQEDEVIDSANPYDFSAKFSRWAPPGMDELLPEIEAEPLPVWLYLLIPGSICLLVLLLGSVFVGENLKIEPIYLLSAKE